MALLRIVLLLCCFPAAVSAWSAELSVGGRTVRAEIADTPGQRAHGLMERTSLCADCGMLFVFERPGRYGFWMKDTPLPLAIAFIAADGAVIDIQEMQPGTLTVHEPPEDVPYALEMNGGWYAAHGIARGGRVTGLERLRK